MAGKSKIPGQWEKAGVGGKVQRPFSRKKNWENQIVRQRKSFDLSAGKAGLCVHLLLNSRESTELIHHESSRKASGSVDSSYETQM